MSKVTSGLLDKLRGSMIGAVIGDCLGAPVECTYWDGIPLAKCASRFQDIYQVPSQTVYEYTDDTAMARQVAESIIAKQNVDPKDMAQRFVKEYHQHPRRGYGAAVGEVFAKLKKTDCVEPFKPGSEQFNGSGSYGNGAAMRVGPIGLFSSLESDNIVQNVTKSAKITHAHPDAINGAVLQAASVMWALESIHPKDISKKLIELSMKIEKITTDDETTSGYTEKMTNIEKYLNNQMFDHDKLIELGNDVSALNSVPAAIFSFLATAQTNYVPPGCEFTENPFERSLALAMSFGGDTDTIMSMTGAISGAFFGEAGIPKYMMPICEGVQEARSQADRIHKILSQ